MASSTYGDTGMAGFGEAGFAQAGVDVPSTAALSRHPSTGAGPIRGPSVTPDPRTDTELVAYLATLFQSALDHPTWVEWRREALQCFQYREGEQWTKEELAVLKKRGQPDTRNNQIHVTIERMVGQFVAQKTRLAFRGRNPPDAPLAETYSDLLLFIRQQTGEEFEERDQALDGFTAGFGVAYIGITFDEMANPKIEVRHKDCFTVFPDPYSRRYDWNEDATFVAEAPWTDLDELKALYPSKARDLARLSDPNYAGGSMAAIEGFKKDNYIDAATRRVRPVSIWYKRKERLTGFLQPDGQVIREADLGKREAARAAKSGLRRIDRVESTIHVGTYIADVLLERKPSPFQHGLFPFVPYFVHRKKSGCPYSPVLIALSMQDAINKRESKAVHLLSTNQTFTQDGNITDKVRYAEEIAKPDGIIDMVQTIHPEKFSLRNNLEMAATQMEMHREGKADFRRIVGVNPEALNERSEVRSGVGLARKQAMNDIITAPIYDNFRRSRLISAKLKFGLIRQYFTDPQVLAITDDLGKTRAITLDDNALTAMKQRTFDLVVEDLPDTSTWQHEQFEAMLQIFPQIAQMGPAWGKIAFQMSDLRDKEAIIKEVEEMSTPPPPEPKIAVSLKWEELPPEQQIAWAQKWGMPELAQAIQANPVPPASQAGAAADIEREQAKTQAVKEKAAVDIQKSQMDLQLAQEKVEIERQKAALQIQKEVALSQVPPRPKAAPSSNGKARP